MKYWHHINYLNKHLVEEENSILNVLGNSSIKQDKLLREKLLFEGSAKYYAYNNDIFFNKIINAMKNYMKQRLK